MHEPFDDTTKAFYQRLFESWGLTVEAEREVFFRGRAIDLVVRCTDNDRVRLQDTVFTHFRWLNDLELKGVNDPLTLANYNRIMMRAWGLGALGLKETADEATDGEEPPRVERAEREADQLPGHRTVTMVCVTRPDRILDGLKEELGFLPTAEPGIYHCDDWLPQWIIHPTELELAPRNYPLLPLAKGKKLEQFIEVCLREGLTDYLQLILDVGLATDPLVIWQKILEVKQMRPVLPEETWKHINEFFRQTPEAQEKLSFFHEALQKGVQKGVQEVLAERAREAEQRGEQRGALHNQQQTLIRLLRRKFSQVPDEVLRQIEVTEDTQRLDEWLDGILDAATLADMGLMSEAELLNPQVNRAPSGNGSAQ